MRKTRHPMLRFCLFWLGVLLLIATPFVGVLPGPGGIFVLAAALALMLQNSHWAKRRFVHTKRRWPKLGHYADMGLRRASARRRRARDLAAHER
ncbi:MAG: hypothetical protein V4472_08250 [Pseudomonadota bacterium]